MYESITIKQLNKIILKPIKYIFNLYKIKKIIK